MKATGLFGRDILIFFPHVMLLKKFYMISVYNSFYTTEDENESGTERERESYLHLLSKINKRHDLYFLVRF
jgi:hypothetical protein